MNLNTNTSVISVGNFEISINTVNHGFFAETSIAIPCEDISQSEENYGFSDHFNLSLITALSPLNSSGLTTEVIADHFQKSIQYIEEHKAHFENHNPSNLVCSAFNHAYPDNEITAIRISALNKVETFANALLESTKGRSALFDSSRFNNVKLYEDSSIMELPPIIGRDCSVFMTIDPSNFEILALSFHAVTGYPYPKGELYFKYDSTQLKELTEMLKDQALLKNMIISKTDYSDSSDLPF